MKIDWKDNFYIAGTESSPDKDETLKPEKLRPKIEPWLTALVQAEHLAVLVGNGLTKGVASIAKATVAEMNVFNTKILTEEIKTAMAKSAERSGRSKANLEDQVRVINEVVRGLEILKDKRSLKLKEELDAALNAFLKAVCNAERGIREGGEAGVPRSAAHYLQSFLLSFASRAPSRERLHLFTTNYDRLIEYAADFAGLRIIDRFVGALSPRFSSSRVDIDMHYNPPGIRGEPRYLEGVIRVTKLHGSIDWQVDGRDIVRIPLPFGAEEGHPGLPKQVAGTVMIYPNEAKDRETAEYPYVELFRDYAAAVCQPNSVLCTYGYGFGDEHINRVITDMLEIPSTHVLIIAYTDPEKRIQNFCSDLGRPAQLSILFGEHFGKLETLVDYYLPKAALDLATSRLMEIKKDRQALKEPHEDNSAEGVKT